ncbi:unnamed protein product, partial [Ceratitis capitata]
MFKATSTCGSLKVRLRRLTEAEISAAQNEVQDTESETSTVEFIIHTGETTSDSNSDGETFGMVRAPTPIVISPDEEEEIRRGEIDITEENSQRPGDGYTEYTRRVTMTMKIFDDRVTNKQPHPTTRGDREHEALRRRPQRRGGDSAHPVSGGRPRVGAMVKGNCRHRSTGGRAQSSRRNRKVATANGRTNNNTTRLAKFHKHRPTTDRADNKNPGESGSATRQTTDVPTPSERRLVPHTNLWSRHDNHHVPSRKVK